MRFPDTIITLYSNAVDLLLLNILPSQYAQFTTILKDLKKRLVVDLGLVDAWAEFLEQFKKKHKTKRR
jgi:hypothetical protein